MQMTWKADKEILWRPLSWIHRLRRRLNKIYMLLLYMQEPWRKNRICPFLYLQDIPTRGPFYPIWALQMSPTYQFCRCRLQQLKSGIIIITWRSIKEWPRHMLHLETHELLCLNIILSRWPKQNFQRHWTKFRMPALAERKAHHVCRTRLCF